MVAHVRTQALSATETPASGYDFSAPRLCSRFYSKRSYKRERIISQFSPLFTCCTEHFGYFNMTDIIIREVTEGIWTFSKPFLRLNVLPIGGRSTAVRLHNGDVWVLASTPLTPDTKKTLEKLGPVKYIVGADSVHHLYLGEFKKAYPDAKLVAVEEAVEKKKGEGLDFAGFWGDKQQDPKFGFEDEIESCYFSGFKNKDVAFLHKPSKTLIEADLLFNMPALEQYSRSWFSGRIPFIGNIDPYTAAHKRMMWRLGVDKEAMKRDAKTVADWDFERIIPCHGDVIDKDGNNAWRSAYEYYLK